MLNREYDQVCSIARTLEVLGERWTLLVIRDVFNGKRRFDQIQAGDCGQAVLAQRPPRSQLNKMALTEAVIADHRQRIAAALRAASQRAIQAHALGLQPDRQRLDILHRHDPQP